MNDLKLNQLKNKRKFLQSGHFLSFKTFLPLFYFKRFADFRLNNSISYRQVWAHAIPHLQRLSPPFSPPLRRDILSTLRSVIYMYDNTCKSSLTTFYFSYMLIYIYKHMCIYMHMCVFIYVYMMYEYFIVDA